MDIDKIISIVKSLREEAVMGAPTNAVGTGQIAGTTVSYTHLTLPTNGCV